MKYLELLKKQQNTPTQGTAKTVITPFYSKYSTPPRHIQEKKETEAPALTPYEKQFQQRSSDWRWFCDSHERTLPDSHCPVKHSRDSLTGCVGWQIKTKRKVVMH